MAPAMIELPMTNFVSQINGTGQITTVLESSYVQNRYSPEDTENSLNADFVRHEECSTKVCMPRQLIVPTYGLDCNRITPDDLMYLLFRK